MFQGNSMHLQYYVWRPLSNVSSQNQLMKQIYKFPAWETCVPSVETGNFIMGFSKYLQALFTPWVISNS